MTSKPKKPHHTRVDARVRTAVDGPYSGLNFSETTNHEVQCSEIGALQFVVLLHFLIVWACCKASKSDEPLSQLPLARLESRSPCTRYVADELTTVGL